MSMGPENPEPSDSLSLTLKRRIDAVCTRFEVAWRGEPPPRIEDFLGDADGPEREALLRELLRVELDCRRQRGDVPTVLEELAEQFTARVRQGQAPRVEEYAREYPELAARIRELFPTFLLLGGGV